MNASLKKLMASLPNDVEGAIITSDENRRYFTGMKSSAGALLLTKTKACFIIDFRYIEKAKKIINDFDVLLQGKLFDQIKDFFVGEGVQNIAIETDFLTVKSFNSYREKLNGLTILKDNQLSDIITKLRAIKSDAEIMKIRKAQTITDEAFIQICDFIAPGKTELEIAIELEYTLRRLGATGLAFESIVVSGVNSSLPHGVPSDKRVEIGDFITMDFGASFDGYCSDMTRTVAVGKISSEQKKVYDTVLEAQLLAIDAIKPGLKYSDIDKLAREYIYKAGYEGCFGHGLGHSFGLNIHENPSFSQTCEDIIEPGVVMTVEPGIYLSNKFGVRIEDILRVNEDGVEIYTRSVKNLITL